MAILQSRCSASPETEPSETSERNFLHRPSAQTVCESRVMHHCAIADVDSMVQKAAAGRDQMRTQRKFLAVVHQPIGIAQAADG